MWLFFPPPVLETAPDFERINFTGTYIGIGRPSSFCLTCDPKVLDRLRALRRDAKKRGTTIENATSTSRNARPGPFPGPANLFQERFGRPGKGNDKGKVEALVKYSRANFLTP